MFSLNWTPEGDSQYREIRDKALELAVARSQQMKGKKRGKSKQEVLFLKVEKTIRLLSENPRHPGFQTREYDSIKNPFDPKQKVFEAYVQNQTPGADRVFWCYGPEKEQITIISITTHP